MEDFQKSELHELLVSWLDANKCNFVIALDHTPLEPVYEANEYDRQTRGRFRKTLSRVFKTRVFLRDDYVKDFWVITEEEFVFPK